MMVEKGIFSVILFFYSHFQFCEALEHLQQIAALFCTEFGLYLQPCEIAGHG